MVLGRVTEAGSQRPLEDVSVTAHGTDRVVLSGSGGWYILSGLPPGSYEIRAEHFGYVTARDSVTVGPGAAISIDFQLSAEPLLLDSLEVLSAPPTLGASGHRIVIGREELEKRKASSTTQLLQGLVAGVTQTTTTGQAGASTRIRMRGGRSLEDRPPLFYVDGVRVGSALIAGPGGTGQVLTFLDNINPADIERIEIVRPAEAALLYGTDAGGGVILIFTRRERLA
jgi:outer membrane receptor protein involved in Fe transport